MKKSFNYTLENYFPLQFFIIGVLGLLVSVIMLTSGDWLVSLLIALPAFGFATMVYATKLDFEKQEIHDLIKVVGITIKREIHPFTKPEKLLIKPINMSQRLNSRGSSTTVRFVKYKGFLITDSGNHLLLEYKNKRKVERIMQKLANKMNLPLEEY